MESLYGMYLEWVQAGVFGRLNDYTVTVNITALPGQRIYAATGLTITLPTPFTEPYNQNPTVGGWIWDYGHPRWAGQNPLVDKALIAVVQDGVEKLWVYKAATASWVDLTSQDLNDPFPLDDGLVNGAAAMLALRLAPEFGTDPSSLVLREANNAQVALTHRYNNPARQTAPFYANPYGDYYA